MLYTTLNIYFVLIIKIITKVKRKVGEKMSYKDLFNLISKQHSSFS